MTLMRLLILVLMVGVCGAQVADMRLWDYSSSGCSPKRGEPLVLSESCTVMVGDLPTRGETVIIIRGGGPGDQDNNFETYQPKRDWKWGASVITLAASNAADVHSSIGKYERNPFVRGADGRFNAKKGIILKAAVVGGIAFMQWAILRKRPKLRKSFAFVNFGAAAFNTGVAIHNYGIRR